MVEIKKYKYGEYKSVLYVELTGENIIEPNESGFITVQMKTDIPNRGDRFGYRETEKGKLYALSFCFPYLADNEKGEWIIEPFFDDGESRSNDLADYSVKLKIPESYEVAMTGKEEKVNDIFITTAKDVRDFAIVACDFMEKESFEVEGIRVNNYYLAGEYAEEYKEITNAVAKDSLSVFSKQIGKYPYEELDIVPCLFADMQPVQQLEDFVLLCCFFVGTGQMNTEIFHHLFVRNSLLFHQIVISVDGLHIPIIR